MKRIGRLQNLDRRASAVVGRLQALQQVFGFPESVNRKNVLWFARQPRKKEKKILFADGTHSDSLPLARDIGHLLPSQADDAVDDGSKISLTLLLCHRHKSGDGLTMGAGDRD